MSVIDTVYISGPMRLVGPPDYNYPQFHEVEAAWREQFPENFVYNPARNFDGDTSLDVATYMTLDLTQVIAAQALVMLPDWERSEGARLEATVGLVTGKRFFAAESYNAGTRWAFSEMAEWEVKAALSMTEAAPKPEPQAELAPRASVLHEAANLITGDRNNQYGPPTQDFTRTAGMASAFGFQVNGKPLEGHHVAIFMMLLKISRLAWTPGKRDSWVDAAGYGGCGYECAVEGEAQAADLAAMLGGTSAAQAQDAASKALEGLRRKLAGDAA